MTKVFITLENIIGYSLVAVCFIISVLAATNNMSEETILNIRGWIPFLYLVATTIVLYKTITILFSSSIQKQIKKRKVILRSIIYDLSKSIILQKNSENLKLIIEAVKQTHGVNANVLLGMLQERLPEMIHKLVEQQVAAIKQNLEKDYEKKINDITFLSAGISDVLERRNYLLYLENEIKRNQEEKRKKQMELTLEYTMLVFKLANTSVEDVEKVCDIVKLFIETGRISTDKDLRIQMNKKLRNAELKQFVINIVRYNEKDNLDLESFILTVFGEWFTGKKENITKNYTVLPKDSLVSKEGLEADLVRLRKKINIESQKNSGIV